MTTLVDSEGPGFGVFKEMVNEKKLTRLDVMNYMSAKSTYERSEERMIEYLKEVWEDYKQVKLSQYEDMPYYIEDIYFMDEGEDNYRVSISGTDSYNDGYSCTIPMNWVFMSKEERLAKVEKIKADIAAEKAVKEAIDQATRTANEYQEFQRLKMKYEPLEIQGIL